LESKGQNGVCQSVDPRERFSSRVENYVKYRPGYPNAVIGFLESTCGLTSESKVADIGSGTGILTELFLKNDNQVFAVEPNEGMRQAAERAFQHDPNFTSVAGSAEDTTLPEHCADFITAAQAFHWFDQARARAEFDRILQTHGWVILLWNERRLSSTDFLKGYEQLLLKYGLDYAHVRQENVAADIAGFYAPAAVELAVFDNWQDLDLDGLQGRLFSASYTPEPGHPDYESMLKDAEDLFQAHEVHGKVTIEYDTKLYYGRLLG
jgi:SAM-dependent methyltransferase